MDKEGLEVCWSAGEAEASVEAQAAGVAPATEVYSVDLPQSNTPTIFFRPRPRHMIRILFYFTLPLWERATIQDVFFCFGDNHFWEGECQVPPQERRTNGGGSSYVLGGVF